MAKYNNRCLLEVSMKIAVADPEVLDEAREISDHLGALLVTDEDREIGDERYLRLDRNGLALVQGNMELRGDFREMLPRITGGHLQHEKLLRAIRFREEIPEPLAVDATAGLGEDSFILAAGGFTVVMCEYNPIIAALLKDALYRAQKDPDIGEIARRMKLIEGNSVEIFSRLDREIDIIYLDPMFPAKKKSGISTKKLQLFQKLETPCADEKELLDAAFSADPRRIVVKRPIKGAPLAGKKAGYSIDCRNVRYDCYAVRG